MESQYKNRILFISIMKNNIRHITKERLYLNKILNLDEKFVYDVNTWS